MVALVNIPGFRATDSNGDLVSGAKLYAYLVGTLTPAQLFLDSNLTTPTTNPAVANASGMFPDLYSGTTPIRIELKTSTGTEIADVDPYISGGLVLAVNTYTIQEVGGVPRQLLDKLHDFVAIKDFGAVGDGITDDTAAFRAAAATGLSIYINPTNLAYMVDPGAIILTANGQGLFSFNRAKAVIKLRSLPSLLNFIYATGTDCFIHNITVDGNGLSWPDNSGAMVTMGGARYRVTDNVLRNFDRLGIMTTLGAADGKILGNHITNTQIIGLKILPGSVVVGAGGTNSVNRVAIISGGTVINSRPAMVLYDVVAGAVSNIRFTDYGRYSPAGSLPTISFPAVPGSSATMRFAADLNTAISVGITDAMQSNIEVAGNYIYGAGVHLRGIRCKVHHNDISGAIYGASLADAGEAGCGLNHYYDNYIHDCGYLTGTSTLAPPSTDFAAAAAGLPTQGFELYGGRDIVHRNVVENIAGVGIYMACSAGKIIDNDVLNCGAYWHSLGAGSYPQAAGIIVAFLDATYNGANVTVRGNRSTDTGLGTQHYGISFLTTITGLTLESNNVLNNVTAGYLNQAAIVPASFKGQRVVGHATWNPPSIVTGTDTNVDVSVPGLDGVTRWMCTPYFNQVATQWVQLSASFLSANTARVRMYSMSGTYDLASGIVSVVADELLPIA